MEIIVYGSLGPEGAERTLAHLLLETALRRELGLETVPPIARGPRGKPWFPDLPDLHFNLSHSHGAAVCALHHLPVGVDVEKVRSAPKRLAAGLGDEAFFRLWTAREAAVKRAGLGVEALRRTRTPDPLCQCLEGFLPGCIVTVCPTEAGPVRTVRV
jgi:4'-phosphopantetheinyl transferase